MLCRITDDPSYDYSDYCEGKGAYAPYEDDHRTEPEDDPENWSDAHLYPPISPEQAKELIAEVKAKQDVFNRQLKMHFGGE